MHLGRSHTQSWLGSTGEYGWNLRRGSSGSPYALLCGNTNSQCALPQGFLASGSNYSLKIMADLRERPYICVYVAGGVPVSCGFKGGITKQKARVGRHICFGKQPGQKLALLVDSPHTQIAWTALGVDRDSPMSLGHFNTGKGTFFWA